MSDLDQIIADLEKEINGYGMLLFAATTNERKLLLEVIKVRSENLNKLIDRQESNRGNLIVD